MQKLEMHVKVPVKGAVALCCHKTTSTTPTTKQLLVIEISSQW
jgi:hypothetical protein